MKREIETTEEPVLQLPGIVATKTRLTVFDSATDEQLTKAFAQIARMDNSLSWWIGDLGIALQERRRRVLAKEAGELRTRANGCTTDAEGMEAKRRLNEKAERLESLGVIEYTRDLCAAFGIGEGHVRNCVMFARFYEPSQRYDGLTPKHHQVAMAAAGGARGDATVARSWLAAAQDKELSASELRKEVNVAKAEDEPAEVSIERLTFEELTAADVWAVKYISHVDALTHEEALRVFTQMQGLMDLGAKLLQAIKEKAPALAVAGGS